MENPTLTPLVVLVLSFVIPPITSLLKSRRSRPIVNTGIALAVAFAAAAISLVLDGGLDELTNGPRLVAFLGACFTLAHVVYRGYFVATPLNARLERKIWGEANPLPPAPPRS